MLESGAIKNVLELSTNSVYYLNHKYLNVNPCRPEVPIVFPSPGPHLGPKKIQRVLKNVLETEIEKEITKGLFSRTFN